MHTRRIAVLATAAFSVATVACHKAPAPAPSPALQSAPAGPNADSIRRAQADEARAPRRRR